jgi:hypothetical protein
LLIIVIPCKFHPAGMVKVAEGMLFRDGSVMVAVVNRLGRGEAETYFAAPGLAPDCAPGLALPPTGGAAL